MQVIITRQTGAGNTVELGIEAGQIVGRLDGKRELHSILPVPEAKRPRPDITHRIGKIALFDGELDQLIAAQQAATPATTKPSLRDERARLVNAIRDRYAEASAVINKAHERDELPGPAHERAEGLRAEARQLETDLAAFDAEHPEFIEAIKTERAARVARNTWM